MKLYNLDHSPYSTRVRMQIYAARLEVDIEPPPVELGTPEFNERFPLAKIPVLATIPELDRKSLRRHRRLRFSTRS